MRIIKLYKGDHLNMKDIIFISLRPFPLRGEEFYFFKELLAAGFTVEGWNVGKVFLPEISLETEKTVTSDYWIDITTSDELLNELKKKVTNNTIFWVWDIIANMCRCSAFFRFLKANKCLTFDIQYFTRLNLIYQTGGLSRRARFALLDIKGKINMIKNAISWRLRYLWKVSFFDFTYDIIISPNPPSNCLRKVFINHFDYETYRKDSHLPDLIKVKYAVFLDSSFPLSQQIKVFGGAKTQPDEENKILYMKLMCGFFSMIEQQFGIKVVVAAHPESKNTEADYGGRTVLRNKACQLTQHAQFVISQGSTAISFAVLRHCPLLFCYTNEYKFYLPRMYPLVMAESQLLKAPFIQVEQYITNPNLSLPKPNIDHEACEKYKYTYLTKPEIENKENKDIIIDFFKSL